MSARPWLKSYDPQVPPNLEYPNVPVYHFLEENARKVPAKTALIFQPAPAGYASSQMTYRELNDLSDRLAAALHDLGIRKGDRVLLLMVNSPQFVISYYAVLKLGAVVVATNPLYSPREMEHQALDSGARAAIVMSRFYPVIKKVQGNTALEKVIVTNIKDYMSPLLRFFFTLVKEKKSGDRVTPAEGDYSFTGLLNRYSAGQRPQVQVESGDLALLQYTGGTTGLPKGAMALHRNLIANTLQIRAWIHDLKETGEIVLGAIPLFHVYGLVTVLNFGIASGSTLVLVPDPRDINNLFHAIQRHRPTIFPGVPTLYNAINNHPQVKQFDLKSIRACISGSAPLMAETQRTFEALTGAALREGYGLSEAPTATHCNTVSGENRYGSIGLPFPDVDCKIISTADGVTELPPGEVGELAIKGPQVFAGYWNMPAETAAVLKDGWLYTGDLAKMDEDGYFYIVDRKKEMIIAGGYNIYPREIEEVIKEHPKVLEVAAGGVPDPYRGETVKVWVVPKPGETLTAEDIREYCKDKLAKFKIPTHVEFRNELPKTSVGKILRRVLVDEEKSRQGPGVGA
ncbi:MAG: long-chain fatty acid--CoA ligase [Bacillota bacterium]